MLKNLINGGAWYFKKTLTLISPVSGLFTSSRNYVKISAITIVQSRMDSPYLNSYSTGSAGDGGAAVV
jgi:hypothetical protein